MSHNIVLVRRVYKIKNKYFMYYLGVNQWIDSIDKRDATYEIRIGTSTNGIGLG